MADGAQAGLATGDFHDRKLPPKNRVTAFDANKSLDRKQFCGQFPVGKFF